jgi:hypothetical protein
MTEFFFPDNTVLCNFAAVNRLDLLKAVVGGRGRWTEAVAYEASRSAVAHPVLASLPDDGWLDEPVEITRDSDVRKIEQIRRAVFGGTETRPLQHLGEAQTCYVIKNWPEFSGSWWITDDREALRYARFQGITTRETIDLMSRAAVDGDVTAPEGFALLKRMLELDRHLRVPNSSDDLIR